MIATFAAGASASFTLVVNANATTQNGTTIMTTAPIASTTTDSDPANNTATETTTVSEAADPDLSVPLSDSPDPVSAGANITYTIRVDNAGPATAAHVVLDDPLPARTTFGSLRAAAAGPARRRPRAAWGRCHAEPHHSPMARPRPSLLWCVSIPPRWRAPLSRTRRL
ncbi:MAG: hypothetical protein DMD49_07505 [Gemmatimonadetes bacterium]|nr:MAG: hypothetical protein DMD49_07505 [Gemmatimonadota bacterium]